MEWCLHFFRNVQQKQNVEYSECDIMRLMVSSILGTNGKKWTNSVIVNLCVCLVAQLCLTLCNPMHCSPPGSSVHGEPKNTGVGSLCLLQGICLTQELNQSLLHCRWTLYQLSLQGKPCVFFFFFFGLFCAACRIFIPQAGIRLRSPALRVQSLNHWTTREVCLCKPVPWLGQGFKLNHRKVEIQK